MVARGVAQSDGGMQLSFSRTRSLNPNYELIEQPPQLRRIILCVFQE